MFSIYSKLSGIFDRCEDLVEQLAQRICFCSQMQFLTAAIGVFNVIPNILDKLDKRQTDFLCFQLYSCILPELHINLMKTDKGKKEIDQLSLTCVMKANAKLTHLFK